ncbi:hypothetical protein DYU11_31680 [Fibrisoma montanum]|uniref:DUF3592 domain-containing protein n=1 Tax=Fibrisoma montanum TaxID=2305895 RepID=A0A418LWC4_9BACT|nr:hypothetical protein [Fibrisoma montanum]RIV17604.1 hypothetical protein DYU11_31680 [Fibrisoma montanum]
MQLVPVRFLLPLLLTGCLALTATGLMAQPTDTLTTEQLLQRKGASYTALIRPSRYLALDVNHALGGFRRHRFFQGTEIHFKARGEKYREQLYDVSDSTFSILVANEVMNRDEPVTFRLDEVQRIYIHRRIPFVTAAGTMLPIAGVVYFAAGVINSGQIDPTLLPVTGILAMSGGIFQQLSNPRYRINKNHRLRVLRTY